MAIAGSSNIDANDIHIIVIGDNNIFCSTDEFIIAADNRNTNTYDITPTDDVFTVFRIPQNIIESITNIPITCLHKNIMSDRKNAPPDARTAVYIGNVFSGAVLPITE